MKIKLEIKDVKTYEDAVIATKVYYYINNAMKHPEWLLTEKVISFDYVKEWNRISDGVEIEVK